MKTKCTLIRAIGVLLALLVFISLPTSILASPCEGCCAPDWEFYYSSGGNNVELETIYPTNASIFYTLTLNGTNTDPCHDGAGNPCLGTYKVANGSHIILAYGHESYFRMLAWRSDKGDSPIVAFSQQNPPN
jgi:hypothetical protein